MTENNSTHLAAEALDNLTFFLDRGYVQKEAFDWRKKPNPGDWVRLQSRGADWGRDDDK